jgi:hypothetical protein
MRFKRGLLVLLLALFLAACGTQTPAPAIPTAEEGMGEINVAELEAAFDATELTNQKNWDKKKFNKFTLKKVVEGYDPNGEHHKYKLAVICKVPKKKNVLAVVGAGYLKNGQSKHFLVPTKYVKCAAFEFEKFGDEVKFELKQSKYDQYSGVKYYGKLKLWGNKLDFKASEFFHLKRGDAKFIVINKYRKVEEKKPLVIDVTKLFKVGYNGYEVDPKNDDLSLKIVCENGKEVVLELGEKDYTEYAHDLRGQKCYIKERFYSDDYQTKQFNVKYANYKYHYAGSKGKSWNDCTTSHEYGKDYDHCQTSLPYKAFHIHVDEYATKLVIVIVDNVVQKEVKKELELKVVKSFAADRWDDHYAYPGYPNGYDELKLVLICGDYKEYITLDAYGKYHSDDRSDLYGKEHCYIKEHFKDDKYDLKRTTYTYKLDDTTGDPIYSGAYNDYDYDGYQTTKSEAHKFDVKHEYGTIIIIIDNFMKKKDSYVSNTTL